MQLKNGIFQAAARCRTGRHAPRQMFSARHRRAELTVCSEPGLWPPIFVALDLALAFQSYHVPSR